jgi:hypothetical protein
MLGQYTSTIQYNTSFKDNFFYKQDIQALFFHLKVMKVAKSVAKADSGSPWRKFAKTKRGPV